MEDDKKKPVKPESNELSDVKKPADENDLRRQLIDQLDKSATEVAINKEEEEVLFYLAYKGG